MLKSYRPTYLPSSDELPCSDDTPVDNEVQNLIPNILLFLLKSIWAERSNWFFGVDMGVYHETGDNPRNPVIPDGFLSLGVERYRQNRMRDSYVVWEENQIVPTMVLEVVSRTPGGEYERKQSIYARLEVLYYVIYNPHYWQRDDHQPFEVYCLENGRYQLQIGEPYWLPEIGLGIGRATYQDGEAEFEALYWYDEQGDRYPMFDEIVRRVRQRAEFLEERTEFLEEENETLKERAEFLEERTEFLEEENETFKEQLDRYRQQFGELSNE